MPAYSSRSRSSSGWTPEWTQIVRAPERLEPLEESKSTTLATNEATLYRTSGKDSRARRTKGRLVGVSLFRRISLTLTAAVEVHIAAV